MFNYRYLKESPVFTPASKGPDNRLIWDDCSPAMDRRPTTNRDIDEDIHVEDFKTSEELYEQMLLLSNYSDEDFEEHDTVVDRVNDMLTRLEDPGDGSPNILYLKLDGEVVQDWWYDGLQDLNPDTCTEDQVKEHLKQVLKRSNDEMRRRLAELGIDDLPFDDEDDEEDRYSYFVYEEYLDDPTFDDVELFDTLDDAIYYARVDMRLNEFTITRHDDSLDWADEFSYEDVFTQHGNNNNPNDDNDDDIDESLNEGVFNTRPYKKDEEYNHGDEKYEKLCDLIFDKMKWTENRNSYIPLYVQDVEVDWGDCSFTVGEYEYEYEGWEFNSSLLEDLGEFLNRSINDITEKTIEDFSEDKFYKFLDKKYRQDIIDKMLDDDWFMRREWENATDYYRNGYDD